jgi:hypothetical protein
VELCQRRSSATAAAANATASAQLQQHKIVGHSSMVSFLPAKGASSHPVQHQACSSLKPGVACSMSCVQWSCCMTHVAPPNKLYVSCRCTWLVARHWVAAVPPMPPSTCVAAQQTMTVGTWRGGHPMTSCPGLSTGRPTAKVCMQHGTVSCRIRNMLGLL